MEELSQIDIDKGSISEADLKTVLPKPYVPIADRGTLGEVFSALNSKGILGTLSAGMNLFSGIYQLVGKSRLADFLGLDKTLPEIWGKVEYAHYSIHYYGDREVPEDDSIFRFQSAERTYFDEIPQRDGSSSNRLNDDLNLSYN